ncbi:MAG: hypothetical protein HQM08_07250 [Candidatus Riflebacteria bacterium]|nr:hypothetical protein [Candidatus Riflebacteria bacterium]
MPAIERIPLHVPLKIPTTGHYAKGHPEVDLATKSNTRSEKGKLAVTRATPISSASVANYSLSQMRSVNIPPCLVNEKSSA